MARVTSSQRLLATIAAVAVLATPALAGPIFLPGQVVDGKFVVPDHEDSTDEESTEEAPRFAYEIRYATINSEVLADGNTSITAEETIHGPEEAVATVCIVPLPADIEPASLAIAAGRTSRTREAVEGVRFLDAKAARPFLEGIVRTTGDVAFAALTGRPIAVIDVFELGERTSFSLAYDECNVASEKDGMTRLSLPLPRTQWASAPVGQLSITSKVTSADPLRIVFSPTHPTELDRTSLFETTARVRREDVLCDEDYKLLWVADEGDLGLRALTFRMDGEDEGYFMVVANPTGREDGSDVLEKDVTFVLDTSGSMRGEKIEQCRAAISYCLDHLGEGDRFNIVTFGTEVQPFRRGLAPNTKQNVEAARDFVDGIVARGRTNIDGALQAALAGDATEGRPRITIFLTDGTPTAGELVPEKILEAATAANVSQQAVYVLGVGHDVNVHLLDKLAERTEGMAEFVEPEEEIDVKVAGLYDRLAHPVLTDVTVDFGDLDTHSVFPRKVPALYRNTRVMLFGRYREGAETTLTVSGTLAGEKREYTLDFTAPAAVTDNANDYVAPLWATRKIGYLLQEMRLHGEDPELLEEVVRLSKKYGIITEYTQFVAMRANIVGNGGAAFDGGTYGDQLARLGANEQRFRGRAFGGGIAGQVPAGEFDFADLNRDRFNAPAAAAPGIPGFAAGPLDEKAALREVSRQIAMARKQETGRWAFNQAKNDKELQSKTVATGVENSYVDRRGNRVALDQFVKHVGGRCFFLQNGQWCESEEAGDREERVVELYSDEYFALLKSNEDFRRAQKLGWALSINIGDERIVVEKKGKRSDLPEPPKVEDQSRRGPTGAAPQPGPAGAAPQNAIPQQQNAVPKIDREIRGLQQEKVEALENVRRGIPGRR